MIINTILRQQPDKDEHLGVSEDMQYQYIPYIWPLLASAFASLSLGVYALLMRRGAKGAVSFILSMAVVTIWSSANALEMSAVDFNTKLFWANMQYFAYCYSPVTLLALCMEFSGYDRWIRSRRVLWLAIIPTLIVILVWTDSMHGLVRYDMRMDYSGSFPVITKKYGAAFFVHAVYSHMINLTATLLLLRAVFSKNSVYRKQAIAMFFGVSLIVVPNILYISGLSLIKKFDITPLFFGPAGLIIAWGIFRFKLFDLVPVARATVIENMDTGIMVLDLQNRVIDINPALKKIIGSGSLKISGEPVEEVCSGVPELARVCTDRSVYQCELSVYSNGEQHIYEVLLSPLNDSRGILAGRLVTVHEITGEKRAQQEYMRQQWRLAVIEERERLARDMHDNLGQLLGFINLQAQGIRQELVNAGVEIASDKLDKLAGVTQKAHYEIREYIRSARYAATMEKDFVSALENDIKNFEEQAGIRAELDIPDGIVWEKLEPAARINVLNIIREALNNIRKHAQAGRVKISFLYPQEGQIRVCIEDDGIGFDNTLRDSNAGRGFGLNIMRERTSDIGADISIESELGKGSRIILCVPIRKGEDKTDEIAAG